MISVIVPVLNQPQLLASFLEQFESWPMAEPGSPESKGCPFEVVMIDNGSNQQTQNALMALYVRYSWLNVVRNVHNAGFGPANNQGAKTAKGETFLFTQPDVTQIDRITYTIVKDQVKNDALYGARLIDWNSGWNFGIPYLEGWFLACTRDIWERIGGFDERYVPADFEDIDLSKTAASLQIPLKMTTGHVGVHAHPGRTWSAFSDREAVTKKNQKLFMEKWNVH